MVVFEVFELLNSVFELVRGEVDTGWGGVFINIADVIFFVPVEAFTCTEVEEEEEDDDDDDDNDEIDVTGKVVDVDIVFKVDAFIRKVEEVEGSVADGIDFEGCSDNFKKVLGFGLSTFVTFFSKSSIACFCIESSRGAGCFDKAFSFNFGNSEEGADWVDDCGAISYDVTTEESVDDNKIALGFRARFKEDDSSMIY